MKISAANFLAMINARPIAFRVRVAHDGLVNAVDPSHLLRHCGEGGRCNVFAFFPGLLNSRFDTLGIGWLTCGGKLIVGVLGFVGRVDRRPQAKLPFGLVEVLEFRVECKLDGVGHHGELSRPQAGLGPCLGC